MLSFITLTQILPNMISSARYEGLNTIPILSTHTAFVSLVCTYVSKPSARGTLTNCTDKNNFLVRETQDMWSVHIHLLDLYSYSGGETGSVSIPWIRVCSLFLCIIIGNTEAVSAARQTSVNRIFEFLSWASWKRHLVHVFEFATGVDGDALLTWPRLCGNAGWKRSCNFRTFQSSGMWRCVAGWLSRRFGVQYVCFQRSMVPE